MENIGGFVADIGAILAVIVASVSLVKTTSLTRLTKKVDITDTLLRRFDTLIKDRAEIEVIDKAETYWLRFWHLQQEEYIIWNQGKGFVNTEFYIRWLSYRRKEWIKNAEMQGKKYRDYWKLTEEYLEPDFRSFMKDKVFNRNFDLSSLK